LLGEGIDETIECKIETSEKKTEQLRITAYQLHAQLHGIKEATDESIAVNMREYNFEQNDDLHATQDPSLLPDRGGRKTSSRIPAAER
jgi:hypothetical protein